MMTGLARTGRWLAVSLCAALLLAGCGLTAPRSNAGFAELDSLGLSDTDRVMSLSIGPALLRFAARHVEGDPETQALLRDLSGVRVRVYTIEGSAQKVAGRMEHMGSRLQSDDWQPVLLVREPGQHTQMLMRTDGDRIAGLVVMAVESDEAVIVNIMGDLKPELFSKTMAQLQVDKAPRVEVAGSDPAAAREG